MLNLKQLKIFLTTIILLIPSLQASDIDEVRIRELGHTFKTVNRYNAVQEVVDELLMQGISGSDITVLTDWDKTINRTGAWEQKDHDGKLICETTKRITREHEVDGTLRDEQIPQIHAYLIEKGIHVIVVTARPPIHDDELPQAVGKDDVLDLRNPSDKNQIHYSEIAGHVKRTLNQTPDEALLEASSRKISKMQGQSRISLTGQKGLGKSFVHKVNDFKVVYVDGFGFVGHDKGPALMPIYTTLDKKPLHTIIIDDSPRALQSYVKVLDQIQGKVHLLYYPAPVEKKFIE